MIETPDLNWAALAPELITGGACMVALLVGMGRATWSRISATVVAAVALVASIAWSMVNFSSSYYGEFAGQLHSDELTNVRALRTGRRRARRARARG